jgi:hypothetical protein
MWYALVKNEWHNHEDRYGSWKTFSTLFVIGGVYSGLLIAIFQVLQVEPDIEHHG